MHLSRVLVLSQTTNPGLRDRFDGWERAAEGSANKAPVESSPTPCSAGKRSAAGG